jgi:hypothetical protein
MFGGCSDSQHRTGGAVGVGDATAICKGCRSTHALSNQNRIWRQATAVCGGCSDSQLRTGGAVGVRNAAAKGKRLELFLI